MASWRWVVMGSMLLGAYIVPAIGCGDSDGTAGAAGAGGATGGDDDSGVCSTAVTVLTCDTVRQNGVEFTVKCGTTLSAIEKGRSVCVESLGCTPDNCLEQSAGSTRSCLRTCNQRPDAGTGGAGGGGGTDSGGTPGALGSTCTSNTECGAGLTCLRPTDNIVPGGGPPNGLCTLECTTTATQTQCQGMGGVCVGFSAASSRAFCVQSCMTGPPPPTKCSGRRDMACAALDANAGFACVPMCAEDAECGTRRCDIGTGFCSDGFAPGGPIGSACTGSLDCNGGICIPLAADGGAGPGVCTATCRLGSAGCGFRTTPADAGPPVGACLLITSDTPNATDGDLGFCAQLCNSSADCTVQDPRWACIEDRDVQSTFRYRGYCMFGSSMPDAGGD